MSKTARDDAIANLIQITGCDYDLAHDILENCNYNLETALNMFFDAQPHTYEENKKMAHQYDVGPYNSHKNYNTAPPAPKKTKKHSEEKTPSEKHISSSKASSATSATSATKSKSKHNYTTFSDLDSNFNKNEPDNNKKSLYTGGASSGLEVKSSAVNIVIYKNGILIDNTPPLIPTIGNDSAAIEGREILNAIDRKQIHPALEDRIKQTHENEEVETLDVNVEKKLDEEYKDTSTPSERIAFQGLSHSLIDTEETSTKKSGSCRITPIDLKGRSPDVRLKVVMPDGTTKVINALSSNKFTDIMRHVGYVPKKIIRRSDNQEIDSDNWTRSIRHLNVNGQVIVFE